MPRADKHPAIAAFNELWFENVVCILPRYQTEQMKLTRAMCEVWFAAGFRHQQLQESNNGKHPKSPKRATKGETTNNNERANAH